VKLDKNKGRRVGVILATLFQDIRVCFPRGMLKTINSLYEHVSSAEFFGYIKSSSGGTAG
jgi:hypothetical protein